MILARISRSMLNRHFHEVLHVENAEDESQPWREGGPASLSVQRFDPINPVFLAMPQDGAAVGSKYILIPIDIRAIGKLDHKAVAGRLHNDRRLVMIAAAPTNVPNDGEGSERTPRHLASQGVEVISQEEKKTTSELPPKFHELPLMKR